jgi:glycerol-3-phosphate dehydrogenase subunit B
VSRNVLVVGGGVAGTAAAWALARAGEKVTVIHDRAGSSALYSGALDDEGLAHELEADASAFVAALGLWKLGRRRVATREGVPRETRGADAALLDLEPLAGRRIAVADLSRDDWDAPLLARALGESAWALATRTEFTSVSLDALRRGHERRIAGHDFAALHDDPERLAALAKLCGEASAGFDAWLLGPWLGVVPGTAERFGRSLSVPAGECASAVGGAAGARFENARDALLRASSVTVRRSRVTAVEPRGERFLACFAATAARDEAGAWEEHDDDELEVDAVVLATGGVAAGGIELVADPERGAHGFRLAYKAPASLSLDGEVGDSGGSLYGPSLEVRGLGVLERIGVHAGPAGEVALSAPGLAVAGDAVAARKRTVLEAVRSGVRAAKSALLKGRS